MTVATDQLSALAKALAAAQKEMPAVEKTAKADTGKFKYSYATLDHLIAKTRPVLNRHGLAIVQMPEALDHGQPGLRTTILHESGESLTALMPLVLAEQDMQRMGAALTYARRYAWAAALGISADEDDDAQSAVARRDATHQQVEEIKQLIVQIHAAGQVTAAQIEQGMEQAYGTGNAAALSQQQADELIARLQVRAAA